MTLIKSISGIRGTIGGKPGEGLSPLDAVKFTAAFANFIRKQRDKNRIRMVIGRDARISGSMVNRIVSGTLMSMGVDVVDGGLSTTPTVEMAVTETRADGGIILTASHNPKQWNALKLLNHKGEFINADEGNEVLRMADQEDFLFADVDELGSYQKDDSFIDMHIRKVIELPLVDAKAIRQKNFRVALDCVNSTGGIALPRLLKALGVHRIDDLNCEPNGEFPHNPEPLPENLTQIASHIRTTGADIGFVVDPDVDRLALIDENGAMFGEEYTLVAVSDYILSHTSGNTVSNLSSTRALRDVTQKHGGSYTASAVGEVNVVHAMKETNAVIGGEGNGGVIYPELHYGRDALVGIALLLTHLAKSGLKCSELRKQYPSYFISKNKIALSPDMDVDAVLNKMAERYKNEEVNTIDGVKLDFADSWVHLRKSNTEAIIRIYAESKGQKESEALAQKIMDDIRGFL